MSNTAARVTNRVDPDRGFACLRRPVYLSILRINSMVQFLKICMMAKDRVGEENACKHIRPTTILNDKLVLYFKFERSFYKTILNDIRIVKLK